MVRSPVGESTVAQQVSSDAQTGGFAGQEDGNGSVRGYRKDSVMVPGIGMGRTSGLTAAPPSSAGRRVDAPPPVRRRKGTDQPR